MDDQVRQAAGALAQALRESEEYRQFKALKDAVMESDANRALLKEYQRAQTRLQMDAVSGHEADSGDVERFQKLSSLLYMNPEVAQYLLAQMRLQQTAGEVFQQIAQAAEMELELPGM